MKIYFFICVFLLIGCSNRSRQNEKKNSDRFNFVSRNDMSQDTLLFSFLDLDVKPLNIDLTIRSFNFETKIMEVVVESSQNDTLVCGNVVYQVKDNNSWVTIPSAFEDVGWIIFPGKKTSSTYGLPHEHNFVAGAYRILFSFTNNENEHYDISAYFELSHK